MQIRKFLFWLGLLTIGCSFPTAYAVDSDLVRYMATLKSDKEISYQDAYFYDKDKNLKTLKDFKGKFLIVNFWATWCGPCKAEMPALVRIQEDLGGEKLEVLAISEDFREIAAVTEYYEKNAITALAPYSDILNGLSNSFHVNGLPSTAYIDHTGKLVRFVPGTIDWDSKEIRRWLKEQLAQNTTQNE